MNRLLFVFAVSVDQMDSTELRTRRAATLLPCTDIGVLRLPAPVSLIPTISPDTSNAHDQFFCLPNGQRSLVRY